LFLVPALIWGSTWLAITYQLGVVDPLVSVAYRFLGAGALLLLYCRLRGISLRFGYRTHGFIALQGLCLFGFNYWVVYHVEQSLPSGLVAIIFSGILFGNVINGRLFLRTPIRRSVVAGGALGFAGIVLVFAPSITNLSLSNRTLAALGLAFLGVELASLGNIVSARNQRAGISVVQANALGMAYGGVAMLGVSLGLGKVLAFDLSVRYVASLTYLTLLGSIAAFAAYLTLLGRIGADRAGYVTLLMPVIALALTTLFEGYEWTAPALAGVALVLTGNYLALKRRP
jgi:drug/metabolite transporter (DMT)-like permease